MTGWLEQIHWQNELVPVITQEYATGQVLMFAWMNREALQLTEETGYAVYFSRSRQRLWRKGEESGHTQRVLEIRLDCDRDVLLITVEQQGGVACHTGRHHCFFHKLERDSGHCQWAIVEPVIKDPNTIYE